MEAKKQVMNFVNVRFIDEEGHQLVDDLKIYNIVGSKYQVNTPCLSGSILTKYKGKLEGVIGNEAQEVTLIYAPLGKLTIKKKMDDKKPENIDFITTSLPDQVSAIKLPEIPSNRQYYRLEVKDGIEKIGDKIEDPDVFMPQDPTKDETVVALTAADVEVYRSKLKPTSEAKTADSKSRKVSKPTSETKTVAAAKETSEEKVVISSTHAKEWQKVPTAKVQNTTEREEGEEKMNLDIPLVMLADAFEQVIVALANDENELTKTQKQQLVTKAQEFLDSIDVLAN